ncbi:IclR family transcriptional regulator [Vreelandella titanicae]|uniref:HTH-type transcriptional repressor AllR n=1 Tax=Vreelandella titanicae TaxID=664683 RepID=A0AAP9NR55_9GAMM|nr:IclR family transcriptional regulator [Halomonas titanicae]QKS26775.1 Transcriptional regulator KdgR [Halomonas titanicae]
MQDKQPSGRLFSSSKQAGKAGSPPPSQTLMRGLDVIEAVSEGIEDIADLAIKTGMTYSTAHRILSALQARHYVTRDPVRGYRLGRKLLELGYRAHSQIDLVRLAHPLLESLAKETSDTVHLGYTEEEQVIYLDKIASRRAVEISSRIGGGKPLISTGIGKALLLDSDETEWRHIYERSTHLLREPGTLEQWLKLMREYVKQGYSYDLGEDEQSIRCVAAPIRDSSSRIIAAISVSSTVDYMSLERMEQLAPVVQRSAKLISAELGDATA